MTTNETNENYPHPIVLKKEMRKALINQLIDRFDQPGSSEEKIKMERRAERQSKDTPIKDRNYINGNSGNRNSFDEDGKENNCNNPDHVKLEEKIKKLNEQIRDLQLIKGLGKPEEIQQRIKEHLNKTKQEWKECLELGEKEREEKHFMLSLLWKDSEKEKRVKEILTLIDNTKQDTLEAYKKLYKEWNKGEEAFDASNDFSGALFTLKNYLEAWENPPKPASTLTESEKNIIEQIPGIIFSISNFLDSLNSLHLERAKNLFDEFNKNDLTIKANPNLNEGITSERTSNTRRITNSFQKSIRVCEKMKQ